MSAARCKSCDAQIVWVVSAASSKRLPLDARRVPNGNIEVREGLAHIVSPAPDVKAYVSHFATCPEAEGWRKQKQKGAVC